MANPIPFEIWKITSETDYDDYVEWRHHCFDHRCRLSNDEKKIKACVTVAVATFNREMSALGSQLRAELIIHERFNPYPKEW